MMATLRWVALALPVSGAEGSPPEKFDGDTRVASATTYLNHFPCRQSAPPSPGNVRARAASP